MSNARILVLSYYFAPDLSACAFRSSALVEQLAKLYPDVQVDVITTYPSRYSSYKPKNEGAFHLPNVTITRISVPNLNTGFKGELVSVSYYYRKVLRLVRGEKYDVVYGTSAKLATAALARLVAKRMSAKAYLDIRDLFVDNIQDMFNPTVARILKPLFNRLEHYALNDVDKLNVVSAGFNSHVDRYVKPEQLTHYTNGVDDMFKLVNKHTDLESKKTPLKVLYAGNVGRAQSLEKIVPKLAKRLGSQVEITIIGDGRKNNRLIAKLQQLAISNVTIHPPVPREELMDFYQSADILFLHLDSCDCLTKVIPSKLFEYAATGLPMLCGVSGFTKEFIEQNIENAAVFMPNDVNDCILKMTSLSLDLHPRRLFCTDFARSSIMSAMAREIIDLSGHAENIGSQPELN